MSAGESVPSQGCLCAPRIGGADTPQVNSQVPLVLYGVYHQHQELYLNGPRLSACVSCVCATAMPLAAWRDLGCLELVRVQPSALTGSLARDEHSNRHTPPAGLLIDSADRGQRRVKAWRSCHDPRLPPPTPPPRAPTSGAQVRQVKARQANQAEAHTESPRQAECMSFAGTDLRCT